MNEAFPLDDASLALNPSTFVIVPLKPSSGRFGHTPHRPDLILSQHGTFRQQLLPIGLGHFDEVFCVQLLFADSFLSPIPLQIC